MLRYSCLFLALAVGCTNNSTNTNCGNGKLDPGETCDPKDTANPCPTACDDGNACTGDTVEGAAASCTAVCSHTAISACIAGDGCCPAGCNHANDADCSASCGNGIVNPGETCDGSNCPTDCNDGNACTTDTLTGSASNCSAACSHNTISACVNGDGCCPASCTHTNDSDCSASCGNGVVETGETCDGSNCPTDCNDGNACTVDTLTGSAANCSAACSHNTIMTCTGGDGCCPAGCTHLSDSDCSATCGNGIVEGNETCDGVNCPTGCNDGNACTKDTLTGSAANCSASCSFQIVTACQGGDGCCPAGCTHGNDSDCSATCGNGTLEVGETCDGNCPTTCNDGVACTKDSLLGSAMNCSAACSFQPITTCTGGDGCCPAGCTHANDSDCSAFCGDRIIEAGETCDGNCPSDCNDGNACTIDKLLGSAMNCSAQCSHTVVTTCTSGDGCCPPGCTHANDSDCSATCGNNIVEAGETCDGNCPANCNDTDACTIDTLIGSAANCSAACPSPKPRISQCQNGDGCCPTGCTHANDDDCLGTSPIGGACAKASDCLTGTCFLEINNGYDGGYCTLGCNPSPSPNPCGNGNHCGITQSTGTGFCVKGCSGPGDCRMTTYDCYDADGDGSTECWSVASGNGDVGAPCTKNSDCKGGQNGLCQTEAGLGFHNGYCTVGCIAPSPSPGPFACPSGSQCLANDGLGVDTCWKNCGAKADCRGDTPGTGYDCFGPIANINGGICLNSADGAGTIGDACTAYWDCDGDRLGACLGFTNGYCTRLCETAAMNCATDGTCCPVASDPYPSNTTCVVNGAGTALALCEKDCTDASTCRPADGFQCVIPPNDDHKECIQ